MFDSERAKVLIKAMVDMMHKQDKSPYIYSIFELTAIWDEVECDGYCWYEEARQLLGEE